MLTCTHSFHSSSNHNLISIYHTYFVITVQHEHTFTLPTGPIKVALEMNEDGMCVVSSMLSASAGGVRDKQLEVGDIIVSLNNQSLSEIDGGVNSWKVYFGWLESMKREVKVLRTSIQREQRFYPFNVLFLCILSLIFFPYPHLSTNRFRT